MTDDSVWNSIVFTWDGSTVNGYANGELKSSVSHTTAMTPDSNTLKIGVGYGIDAWRILNGTVDDVKIYPFALTDDEIKVEYNQGKAIVLGAASTGVGGTGVSFSAGREYCVPGDSSTCSAPVGEWKMDTGSGTSAYDTSGNNNIGTLTNGPVWTRGKYSNGVSFDGTDDYISVADSSSLSPTSAITLSTWVLLDTITSTADVISKYLGADTRRGYLIRLSSGEVQFLLSSDGTNATVWDTDYALSTKQWYHLALTADGSNMRLYVNGILSGSNPHAAGIVDNSEKLFIGASELTTGGVNTSAVVDGIIDQVRIYDYARTPAQVAWEYNQGKPIAHYRFDECQGTTAYNAAVTGDRKAAGNNGTIYPVSSGNTAVGTCGSGTSTHMWYNGAIGRRGASLDFDGSDDYVSIPHQSYLNSSTIFSVSMWIKTSDTEGALISKHDENATNGLNITISSGKFQFDPVATGTHQNLLSTTSINDGNWHHVVGTLNGTDERVYVDGRLDNSRTYSGTIATNSLIVNFGRQLSSGSPTNYYDGLLDDVQFFSYALTPQQVKTLMNDGAVRFE